MLNLNNSPSDLDNIRSKVSFKDISREIRAEMNQDNPFTEMNLKYLNSWAVELYKNSKISQSNKIVIADLSFKISNFKGAENEKLLTNDNPFLYIVYAHHDGNEVLKMYNNPDNKPETPYQVLLFIETDDGKFDFGKIVRVKFGSQVANYLTEKKGLITNSAELLAERYLKAVWDTSVSLKTKEAINNEKATTDFKNLLVRAIEFEHKNIKLDDFSWFLLIVQGLYFANMDVPKWLFETSHWIRSKKYKEAKYWNGDLPEKEYEPAFLPNSIFYNQPEDRKNAISEIINHPIKELHKEINQKLTSIHPLINVTRNHVNKVFENIYEITGGFVENLSVIEVPDGFLDVYLKHVNAFWVGIYNGILELIAGIFDLIAIVIMISKEEFGFRMGDGLKEIFENLFNDVFYDTYEFIDKVLSKIGQLFIKLAIWIETYEGKSYYIVKEIGEIIPEALTFLIPVLKGSKVAKVGAISGKAGKEIAEEATEQTVKELSEQEAKQIAKTAKETLEDGSAKKAQQQGLKEAEEKLDEFAKQVDEVTKKINKIDEIYNKGYEYKKVEMPNGATITKLFSTKGHKLVAKVEQKVKQLNKLSKTKKNDIVLVNGIISRKYIDDVVMHTNFPDSKLQKFIINNNIDRFNSKLDDIKKIYKYYLEQGHIKYDLHPMLEKRIAKHYEELQKGIKHTNYQWNQTGGLPGVHAEVLSVNEMLHRIESVMNAKGLKMTDEIFTEMIGFNKNLTREIVMIRCGDCNFLTYDIPFIEQFLK